MNDMKNKTFAASVRCAIVGIGKGLRTEKNFKYYAVIAAVFLAADIAVGASSIQYCIYAVTTAAVFAMEFMNTAVERLADRVAPEFDSLVADAKDIAAAAVLTTGIGFFVTQGIIIISKL